MKVFKFYFLVLLLSCFSFLAAQEAERQESEAGAESAAVAENAEGDGEKAKEEGAPTAENAKAEEEAKPAEGETAAEEAKPAEGETAAEEAKPAEGETAAEEAKPAEGETAAEEAKPAEGETAAEDEIPTPTEGQSDLEAQLAAEAASIESETDEEGGESAKKEEEKKFNLGLNNGLSHGFAKERKSFSYTLNLFASYQLPWKLNLAADVGLLTSYRYGMDDAIAAIEGGYSTGKVNYAKFDGAPLNIGLSRPFPVVAGIVGSLGIGLSLPFTSTELWEQYEIRAVLGLDFGLSKAFKLKKDVSLSLGFGFNYSKTFAETDYAWDSYANEPISTNQNHNINLNLGLTLAYKSFAFRITGGYIIQQGYQLADHTDFWYDNYKSANKVLQDWSYLFSFGAVVSYKIEGWNFALGLRTNALEFDNGNYGGFTTVEGDPIVKNGSSNYPFKPQYTTIFANIGYSYSF